MKNVDVRVGESAYVYGFAQLENGTQVLMRRYVSGCVQIVTPDGKEYEVRPRLLSYTAGIPAVGETVILHGTLKEGDEAVVVGHDKDEPSILIVSDNTSPVLFSYNAQQVSRKQPSSHDKQGFSIGDIVEIVVGEHNGHCAQVTGFPERGRLCIVCLKCTLVGTISVDAVRPVDCACYDRRMCGKCPENPRDKAGSSCRMLKGKVCTTRGAVSSKDVERLPKTAESNKGATGSRCFMLPTEIKAVTTAPKVMKSFMTASDAKITYTHPFYLAGQIGSEAESTVSRRSIRTALFRGKS